MPEEINDIANQELLAEGFRNFIIREGIFKYLIDERVRVYREYLKNLDEEYINLWREHRKKAKNLMD